MLQGQSCVAGENDVLLWRRVNPQVLVGGRVNQLFIFVKIQTIIELIVIEK